MVEERSGKQQVSCAGRRIAPSPDRFMQGGRRKTRSNWRRPELFGWRLWLALQQ